MRNEKGQISTEFIFSLGIVLVVFLMMIYLSSEKTKEVKDIERTLEKKAECTRIANFMSGVFALGPGAEKTSHTSMRVYVRNDTVVEIQRKGHTQNEPAVQCRFSAMSYERNFTGDFKISNINNAIVIT